MACTRAVACAQTLCLHKLGRPVLNDIIASASSSEAAHRPLFRDLSLFLEISSTYERGA